MAEYIEREAAYNTLTGYYHHSTDIQHEALREALGRVPAADVVPVVRCEKCRHWHRCLSDDRSVEYFNFSYCEKGHNGFPTFFCADGVRKDGDGNG